MPRHECRSCQEVWSCDELSEVMLDYINEGANSPEEAEAHPAYDMLQSRCLFHRPTDPYSPADERAHGGRGRRLYSCPNCDEDQWRGHVMNWYAGEFNMFNIMQNVRGAPPPPDPDRCMCNRCA